MRLAVVLPSRGLVFSKTVEELYDNLQGLDYKVFWSHCRPIPDCFNVPTEEALKGTFDFVLFVEEDMVLPKGVVKRMLKRVNHAITCDYPVSGGSGGTVMYDPKGVPFFTGTGLLLVRTDLLRRMSKPIWRSDVRWEPWVQDGLIHFQLKVAPQDEVYGQQDVAFGLRLYANGLPIEVMDETIGQRSLVTKAGKGTNNGSHKIVDRLEVVKRTDLMRLPKRPDYQEIIVDGKRVRVRQTLFEKLDNPEMPTYLKAGSAIFENEEALDGWLRLSDG